MPLICLTACVVNDLTLVFGFLSGIAECLITFILPSIFYYKALKMEGNNKSKVGPAAWWEKTLVALFFAFGVAYFFVSNYYNVVKIMRAA